METKPKKERSIREGGGGLEDNTHTHRQRRKETNVKAGRQSKIVKKFEKTVRQSESTSSDTGLAVKSLSSSGASWP